MAASDDTAADFEGLIERLRAQPRESEWLEFKENLADADEIGQYVSALSNSAALHGEAKGYLVWGVEDGSHKLVGTVFDLNTAKKVAQRARCLKGCVGQVLSPERMMNRGA